MSGTGRVLSTGTRSRPDDGRRLIAVLTDGRDERSGFDSFYLALDGPVPPDGVLVTWAAKVACWTLPDGTRVVARKVGMTFGSGIARE